MWEQGLQTWQYCPNYAQYLVQMIEFDEVDSVSVALKIDVSFDTRCTFYKASGVTGATDIKKWNVVHQ